MLDPTTRPAPAATVVRIRLNGKVDVRTATGARVALASDLTLLAGPVLTDAELSAVRSALEGI